MSRVRLRELRPSDMQQAERLLEEQNERDGTSYALPRIFDWLGNRLPNIAMALVAADHLNEAVIQVHVWETTLEQTSYGTGARGTVTSVNEQNAVWWALRQRGFTHQHLFVPLARVADLEKGLDERLRMIRMDKHMACFFRMLDPAENEKLRKFYESR